MVKGLGEAGWALEQMAKELESAKTDGDARYLNSVADDLESAAHIWDDVRDPPPAPG